MSGYRGDEADARLALERWDRRDANARRSRPEAGMILMRCRVTTFLKRQKADCACRAGEGLQSMPRSKGDRKVGGASSDDPSSSIRAARRRQQSAELGLKIRSDPAYSKRPLTTHGQRQKMAEDEKRSLSPVT